MYKMFAGKPLAPNEERPVASFRDQTVFKVENYATFSAANDLLIDVYNYTYIDSATFTGWTGSERENIKSAIVIEFDLATGRITHTQDVTNAMNSPKFPEYFDRLLPRNGRALYIQNEQGGNAFQF